MASSVKNLSWGDAGEAASCVAQRLVAAGQRIVLAESCTSGLMAATMAGIPGISAAFCGSAVTYRDATKRDWLGVDQGLLDDVSAVSAAVTQQMALSVLQRTAEADWALAITGHLGPGAPPELDGNVYVSVAFADRDAGLPPELKTIFEKAWRLDSVSRHERQFESCITAWRLMASTLSEPSIKTNENPRRER